MVFDALKINGSDSMYVKRYWNEIENKIKWKITFFLGEVGTMKSSLTLNL